MADSDSTLAQRKAAKAAYLKQWHEKNKERLRIERAEYFKAYRAAKAEKYKAWREANRESRLAYAREYYRLNKEKMNAAAAEHYRANAEEYKQRARQWELENPERKRERQRKYYAQDISKSRERSRLDWQKNNAKRRAAKVEYRRRFPELGAHHCRLRQTRRQRATPAWADLVAIKAIYADAARLRRETGESWHVDHEIPLKHPLVCGLHVPANLRVIPGAVNQSKGNGFSV